MFSKLFKDINVSSTGNIHINGKTYKGNSVSVIGNKVFIDGKEQASDSKTIKIEVSGDIKELTVDHANEINIKGTVGSVKTSSGNVCISGDVTGSIITSSGDVECGRVGGNIDTNSGDISYRKI